MVVGKLMTQDQQVEDDDEFVDNSPAKHSN